MQGSRIRNRIFGIAILVFIAGCAKVSTPTGGPKDRQPPVVMKCKPEKGAKNFRGDEVSITFDEYVQLDNINQKFMVSPPMKKKPKIFLKGKSVVVQFQEALKDSTTYTLNFQDAIRDLDEGNILNNYQFVFSTGPIIDSLSVTGNVLTSLTLDPPEDVLVLLYHDLYDSAVVKHIPTYISRVSKTGYFRIDNVKAGKYRLYALKDVDNSKNYNLREEEFAFLHDTIEVNSANDYIPVPPDTVKPKPVPAKIVTRKNQPLQSALINPADTIIIQGKYKLFLFQALKTAHYLTSSSRNQPYKLQYTLSLPPDTMPFSFRISGAGTTGYFIERSVSNDTMTVWLTDTALYHQQSLSTVVGYPFTDSTKKVIEKRDTIPMRFLIPKSVRARTKKQAFSVSSPLFKGSLVPGQQIVLQSQTPFGQTDTSRIMFTEELEKDKDKDKDKSREKTQIRVPYSLICDTASSCRLIMLTRISQGKSYRFIADSAAFRNIYGDVSDSAGYKVMMRKDDTFGKLTLIITGYSGDRIIQLLSPADKPVREIKMQNDGKVVFPYLERGKYRLRVIYDLNGDGKWTPGDFDKGILPEPVSFYPQELEVKENWELTQNWNISEMNVKKLKSRTQNTPGRR